MAIALRISIFVYLFILPKALANPGNVNPNYEFTPPPNGLVRAILPLKDGGVLVGGDFLTIGDIDQPYLARYDATGAFVEDFDISPTGPVYDIEFAPGFERAYLIAGDFLRVGGLRQGGLSKITDNGEVDTDFLISRGFDGPVYDILVTDGFRGTIYVAGNFSSYSSTIFRGSTTRTQDAGNLVSLDEDGRLNENFSVNGTVNTLAKDESRFSSFDDIVFAGGEFTEVDRLKSHNLVILEQGRIERIFSVNESTNGPIFDLSVIKPTSFLDEVALIINGGFSTLAGEARTNLGALRIAGRFSSNATELLPAITDLLPSGMIRSINTDLSDPEYFLLSTTDGHVARYSYIIAPDFVEGQFGNLIFVQDRDFQLDGPANGNIEAVVADEQFTYLIAGDFQTIGDIPRTAIARLYGGDGASPPAPPNISQISLQADRGLFEIDFVSRALSYELEQSLDNGESWSRVSSLNSRRAIFLNQELGAPYSLRARSRNFNGFSEFGDILQVTPPAGIEFTTGQPFRTSTLNHDPNFIVDSIHLLPEDQLFIGGLFSRLGDQESDSLALLNKDLSPTHLFNPGGFLSGINQVASDPNGFLYAIGSFRTDSINNFGGIIRLNQELKSDFSFSVRNDFADFRTASAAFLDNGQILLGGGFNDRTGAPRNHLARLNNDGTLDENFDIPVEDDIDDIIALGNDRFLLIGDFDSIGGVDREQIAIINGNGVVDESFNPQSEVINLSFSPIAAISPQYLYATGSFSSDTASGNDLIKFNYDGTVDETFTPDFTGGSITALAVQNDGKILVAGRFDECNGLPTRGMARLNVDGSVDETFDIGLGVTNSSGFIIGTRDIEILSDGTIVIAGGFNRVNGDVHENLCLLRGDLTAFKVWSLERGFSTTEDNSDGDTLPLLFEYAYNLDPRSADTFSPIKAEPGRASVSPPVMSGVSITGLFSTDLSEWTEIDVDPEGFLNSPIDAAESRGFFRLQLIEE